MKLSRRSAAPLIAMLALGLAVLAPTIRAADPQAPDAVMSDDEIASALKPAKTRGVSLRGLKRTQTAAAMSSVNLNIPFEYNSSDLKPEASAQLKQLASALSKESLRNDRFLVAGHTDAKGNPQYNKQLSLRRAESVRRFLVAGGIDTARLDTVGFGSEQPLAPDQPDDPKNRRVEIRDLGEAPAKP
jgi:OmpA-OmpF porin, OOP family